MTRTPETSRFAHLFAALLLLPLSALADDEADTGNFTDSPNERVPAVTAFPEYPSIARRDRTEGEAVVCFHIDARGRVVRPSIRSSTHKIFEKPAMRAIRRSSFAPLADGEKATVVKTCRTYRFRLDRVNEAALLQPPAVRVRA
jgi:TonB family protein